MYKLEGWLMSKVDDDVIHPGNFQLVEETLEVKTLMDLIENPNYGTGDISFVRYKGELYAIDNVHGMAAYPWKELRKVVIRDIPSAMLAYSMGALFPPLPPSA